MNRKIFTAQVLSNFKTRRKVELKLLMEGESFNLRIVYLYRSIIYFFPHELEKLLKQYSRVEKAEEYGNALEIDGEGSGCCSRLSDSEKVVVC